MMFQPEKFSDYLSMIALALSLVSLTISWKNYSRDRSHLKMNLDYTGWGKQGKGFQVTIINDGRRTATVSRLDAYFWFRKPETIFQQKTLLTEGNSKEILVPPALISSVSGPLLVRAFEVMDSVGHKYRANTFRLFWKILLTKN